MEPKRWNVRVEDLRTAVRVEAVCKGHTEDMYPRDERDILAVRRAKAVCYGHTNDGVECPVRWECLLLALASHETDGIWGGATGRERERMRRAAGIDFGGKV